MLQRAAQSDRVIGAVLPARPLRVLLSGYRSHPHVGGQGVYVRELSRALHALGHQVTVISGPPYPELPEGVSLIELPSLDLFAETNAMLALRWRHLRSKADMAEWLAHNTGTFGEPLAFGLRLERWLQLRARDFDVLHDNQTLASPFLRINRRLPTVATLHHPVAIDRDYALAAAQTRTSRWLTRRWYGFTLMQAKTARGLPRLLAVSAASRDSHAALYGVDPARVRVAFNGIDHALFHPDPVVKREPGHIVTVASADAPIKGLDVLIRAFAQIAPDRPRARLTVIGKLRDGPAKQALDAALLGDRVRFVSGLAHEDVPGWYRRAAVVACPARFEGFGFPAAEAMACGAPVAASDGGALPEVVGECGLVSPAGDDAALAANLAALLDDPDHAARLGEAAAKRARDAFDWTDHARAATRLYIEAMTDAGRC